MRNSSARRLATLLAVALGLTACRGAEPQGEEGQAGALPEGHPPVDSMPAVTRIAYECEDGKTLQLRLFEGQAKAEVLIDGESHALEQVPAASGMRYSDGALTFVGKGPEAFVEAGGEPIVAGCRATGHMR